jgi:hypothetical protein
MLSLNQRFGERNLEKDFDLAWMHSLGQLLESLRLDVRPLVRLEPDDLLGIASFWRVDFSLKGFGWYTILK